jgi:hypothetical protein
MLVPLFSEPAVIQTEDGSSTTVTDTTVYGGAEFDRNEVALLMSAVKVAYDLTETALEIETYDPLTVTTFTIINTIDGWQKFTIPIIPLYNAGTGYTQYQCVYSGGVIYQKTTTGTTTGVLPPDGNHWAVRSLAELIALFDTAQEPDNVVIGVVQTVLTFASRLCLDDTTLEEVEGGCCDDCSNKTASLKAKNLYVLVYVAQVANTRQEYRRGEKFVRKIDSYCTNCC